MTTTVSPRTDAKNGWVAGQPRKFVRGHSRSSGKAFAARQKGMAYCSKCDRELPLEAFGASATRAMSRQSACLGCQAKYAKDWRKNNPERFRERQKAFMLRTKYGVTVEQYQKMLEAQGGVCAICGGGERRVDSRTGTVTNLAVDHCHATGVVRGLLCSPCNQAIGLFQDSPEILRRAADYLAQGRSGGE